MRYLAVLLAVLAFAGPAAATPKRALLASIATQTLQGSTIDDNYALGQCAENASTGVLHPVPCATHITGTGGTVTGTGATGSYVTNADGSLSLRTAAPRIGTQGLLVEQASSNVSYYSQAFSNWTNVGGGDSWQSTTALAPDGTNTAGVFLQSANAGVGHYVDYTATSITYSAAAYTMSVYVKPGNQSYVQLAGAASAGSPYANFNLTGAGSVTASGLVTSTFITQSSGGWYRVGFTWTASASTTYGAVIAFISTPTDGRLTTFAGNGTSTIQVWGVQIETGTFPTSYIPTTSAPVTRAADVVTLAGAAASAFYQWPISARFVTNGIVKDATSDRLLSWNTGNQGFAGSGGQQLNYNASIIGTYSTGNWQGLTRSVWTLSSSNISAAANGSAVQGPLAGSYTNSGTIQLGDINTSTRTINGYISRLTLWPYALPSAVMQSLSAQ